MATLVLKGKFLGAGKTHAREYNGKTYHDRVFWLDKTDGDHSDTPEFKLKGDKCILVDNLEKGDEIEVSFNLKGVKYTDKTTGKDRVFNDIVCWKIDKITKVSAVMAKAEEPLPGSPTLDLNDGDDLPF